MQKVERPKFQKSKDSKRFGLFKSKQKSKNVHPRLLAAQKNQGLFSRFKKTPKPKQSSISSKYSDVAQQRKKAILKDRLKEVRISFPIKTILIAALLIVGVGIFLALRNSAFDIKDVVVIAPKEVVEDINLVMQDFKGKNIYLVSEEEVFSKIKEKVPEIEKVYLYKELPSTIQIEALAGDPVLILANLDQVNLLDINGQTIGTFGNLQKIELLDFEKDILSGKIDLEAEYIKNKYIENKTDQEKLQIDWPKVPVEEKTAVYNNLKQVAEGKVVTYFNSVQDIYSKSVYNSLPLIESYYISQIDKVDLDLSIALIDSISSRGVRIVKNFLSTKFTLDVYSEDNKLIRLSLQRGLEAQIKELDTIIYYGYFSSAKIIDLRIDTGSITR